MDFRNHSLLCGLALTAAAAAFGAVGCNAATTDSPHDRFGGFISENPKGTPPNYGDEGTGTGTGGGGGGGQGGASAGGDDAERAIAEADIIQVQDGKLYALSQYSGLSVIDVGVQDKLTLLGRYQVSGAPFEMYLRDGVVYAMFSDWGRYVYDAPTGMVSWVQSSRIEALDVSDPLDIHAIGVFDLPGFISDSRIVGDVLYAVTYEDGYCWGCAASPNTTVTSLAVADPTAIDVVDQLHYSDTDPYGYGWRRSVAVTPDRMYVAGIEWDGASEGHSTIQVIDISDPSGLLVEGASVEAKGQIMSRWQMDEHDGVLRVISQPGVWWSSAMPSVQTFTVASAQDVTPLGALDLQLPQPEQLRSVRFDGTRAYAITAVQTDPLFTIDLSDPAQPVQMGELVMPGWVYHMEPRGDRILALGFDNTDPNGSLNVSLFDVSDLSQPAMLERVAFGGQWSSVAEDQDRIHKAFSILDTEGLILVPYNGWEYDDTGSGCGSYRSGIQLIDFTADTLALRGDAASRGQARRAFLHDSRLFAVSDEEVRTFNIANRDAPQKSAELALATVVNQTAVVGDVVARLSADWWTTEARLEVVPVSSPGDAEPIGTLDLNPLFPSADGCYGWGLWGARMFANGQYVYLVWPAGDLEHTRLAVLDLTNPASPALAGQIDLAAQGYDPYGWYGTVVASGDPVVQSGSTLVFRRYDTQVADPYDSATLRHAWLDVVDLSNPAQPVKSATVALPLAAGHTALRVEGSTVMTSHWVPLSDDPDRARFYFDRIDVSDPYHPVAAAPVNVPGSLVSFDGDASRLLTVDYQRVEVSNVTADQCWQELGYDAVFEPADPNDYTGFGDCRATRRAFKLTDVSGDRASLRDTLPIEDGTYVSGVFVGDDRVFAAANNSTWYEDGGPYWTTYRVLAVGGMHDGELVSASASSEELSYTYPVGVDGDRLINMGYGPPTLSVLDAADLDTMAFEAKGELDGYAYSVTVDDGRALCSLGPYGLQVIELD